MATASVETLIVIGSAGHAAQRCMQALRDRYRMIGLDVPGTRAVSESDAQVGLDLASDQGPARAVAALRALGPMRVAAVLILAADFDPSRRPSPLLGALNVERMRGLLVALGALHPEQWILLSSMHVHAPRRLGCPINEASPLHLFDAASEALVALEHLIIEQRAGAQACVLRAASLYDDGGFSTLLAAAQARATHDSSTHLFDYRNAREGQPLLHLADLADAIDRAIVRRACLPPVTVLLLAEPEPLSFKGLQLADSAGYEPHLFGLARGEVRHYEVDAMRARLLLGWAARRRVADALPAEYTRISASVAPASMSSDQIESVAPF